ncbi:MAG: radical SAM protein [candidate division KSB1 bacterium]|nr:radical SAM protein [candidate division KSB1 bacterium]
MNSQNILLVNPWIFDFAAYDFWIKPIGLLSIGHYLEQHGYRTYLIDCLDRFHPLIPKTKQKKYGTGKFIRTEVEKPAILKHIPRKYCRYGLPLEAFFAALDQIPQPAAILVTSGMTYWYPGPQFAIRLLRERFPNTMIALGGIYATLCYDHALRHAGADIVIKGPGEIAALKMLDKLTGNDRTIDDRNLEFPTPTYHYYQKLISVPVITSMGCPYRCSFCASHLIAGKFRQRDPEMVIEEIEYYYRRRHVRHFAFYDDALLINQERHLSAILDTIIERKLHIDFHTPNGMHAKEITPDLAKKMFQANFKTIRLSFETVNPARRPDIGNKIDEDALANALDYLEQAGYRRKEIDTYVIMGLPNQSVDEVVEGLLFVIGLGSKAKLTSFSPIPGTLDWDRAVQSGNLDPDIDPLLTNNSIFPLRRADFTYDMFQKVKNLAKVLNYGLDHGINLFDRSFLARIAASVVRRGEAISSIVHHDTGKQMFTSH